MAEIRICPHGSKKNIFFTIFFAAVFSSLSLPAYGKGLEDLIIQSGKQKHHFQVEIARTEQERSQGMMYREKLDDKHGMLFLLPEKQHAHMWMKNTRIMLDVIFIDSSGMITEIVERRPPNREDIFISKVPVIAILEIKGGTSEKLGIKEGDTLHHVFFSNL